MSYWQVNNFEFVDFDDYLYIVDNQNINQGLTIDSLKWAFSSLEEYKWQPLTWISFMAGCEIHGLDPGWHH